MKIKVVHGVPGESLVRVYPIKTSDKQIVADVLDDLPFQPEDKPTTIEELAEFMDGDLALEKVEVELKPKITRAQLKQIIKLYNEGWSDASILKIVNKA